MGSSSVGIKILGFRVCGCVLPSSLWTPAMRGLFVMLAMLCKLTFHSCIAVTCGTGNADAEVVWGFVASVYLNRQPPVSQK